MSKWDENKLDQELENLINDLPEQDDFDKRIEQYINRRIRKIVHKTLATVVIVGLILAAIINPMLNFMCLNPKKELYIDVMRDYFETTRPFSEITSIDAKSTGFGTYKLNIGTSNHYDPLTFGSINVTAKMAFGKLYDINDNNRTFTTVMGRFDNGWSEMDENGNYVHHNKPKEEYIESISKLPESSKIYLAINSATPQDFEVLRSSGVNLEWIEIYQPNVAFRGGLSMNLHSLYNIETDYRQNMSEKELLDVYVGNLENLAKNTLIWRQFELPGAHVVYMDVNLIKDTLEDARELDQILTENYCIYGERDAIINYLENTDIISTFIEKITLY